jgi:ZIP family zinc transporter
MARLTPGGVEGSRLPDRAARLRRIDALDPCYEHGPVSLLVGIAILALAVCLGGLAALFHEPARWAMAAIRSFAVVAAAAIALLHLLPEAIAAVGFAALIPAFVAAFGPAVLERAIPSSHAQHEAPTTALAMGYAAVIAHQAGEGAALASLAETGALSLAIVLAIAAHTVPLAMVVGIRVIEVKGGAGRGGRRATGLALLGVVAATSVGAAAGSFFGGARLAAVQPWLLAAVAGLLLHALSHDALAEPARTTGGRVADTCAGWAGLGLAVLGVEHGGWIDHVPWAARVGGVLALGGVIAARSLWPRRRAHEHEHS